MKKILVTGGTGYIGSHTVVELQNAGYGVIIVDDLSNSSDDSIDRIERITGVRPEFINLDLKDFGKTEKFFATNKDIEAIIHFAAYMAVAESVKMPLEYYNNNLSSLMNVLLCMRKYKIENIVFSSSCTVYGQADTLPVTENTSRKVAESPYGNTKSICEDILRDSASAYDKLNVIALRYFNPIGAHPSALIGEIPNGVPSHIIPFITQTAAGLREQLSVFGGDYNTSDGSCVRDYIDVVDLSNAHVVAINRLLEKKNKSNYEFFNIGTGTGISVLEIIEAFKKATGIKINYRITQRRDGDIEKVWADTSLANNELGWKAITPIEETLANAWRFQQRFES